MAAVTSTGGDQDGDLVVFDYVKFGLMSLYRRTGSDGRQRLISRLIGDGVLRSGVRPSAPLRFSITARLDGGIEVTATVVLHVREIDDGLFITGGSTVETNLQSVLRQRHSIPQSAIGLDGKRNFSKPTAELGTEDVEAQIQAIGKIVDTLCDTITSSLPGCEQVEGTIWLRGGEVCHDLACPNAEDVVRASCKVPPKGSRTSWQRDYDCTTGAGRSPTWHFTTLKRGPISKGYLKAPGLPRTEVSCPHRDAIFHCTGERKRVPLGGKGAVELSWDLYISAGELCCTLLDHVREVARGGRTIDQLLTLLDPIKAIAERVPVGSGYRPSAAAADDARRVLNGILSDGLVHLKGLRKGTKVRDAVDALRVPGGPLVQGASPGICCLAPEYGMAAPDWNGEYPFRMRG